MKVRSESDRGRVGAGGRVCAVCAAAWVLAGPAQAADLNGSARVYWTGTELDDDSDFSTVEQSYNLSLYQPLTRTWALRAAYTHGELDSRADGTDLFSRRRRQPRIELLLNRPDLSGRLSYEDTMADGSASVDTFESRAVGANVAWQAREGLRFNFSLRDASNRADVSALGREYENRTARIDATYDRTYWGLGYGGNYNRLENRATGSGVRQLRHDLRFHAGRRFAADRVSIGASALAGYVDSAELRSAGDLAEAWPAVAGLAAIDPSPALGDLAAAPGLIDGDFDTPLTPPIEIGGGNTFRNLGVDLGVRQPVTRLEIAVDRPSGAQLAWEVYHSADNLIWEPIPAVLATYDPALLRYTLRFGAFADRYFKAVNVSVNPATTVSVTEVRALREIDALAGDESRGSALHSAAIDLGWRIGERVRMNAGADASNDRTTIGGVTRRDYRTTGARAGVEVDLSRDLRLGVRYRLDESSERRGPLIRRSVGDLSAVLSWAPIPTVDAALSASNRDERDEGSLLSTVRSTRLRVGLALLDSMRLDSELGYDQFDSQLAGYDRETWNGSVRFGLEPWASWRINGGVNGTRTATSGESRTSFDRTNYFLTLNWSPGSSLALTGTLLYYDEDRGQSLRQTYALSWSPGTRLAFSLVWDQFEERDGRLVGGDGVTVTYRLARWAQFAAGVNRSRSDVGAGPQERITSARAGTTIVF